MHPRAISASAPSSERAVWAALKELPNEWHVFHHLEWQGHRDGRPGDGEADFVLLHGQVGIVVIEVKGGGIAVRGREWFSIDRHGARHSIHDPFEQAKSSKYALLSYLHQHAGDLERVPAGHAVALPDMSAPTALGMNAPAELMISRPDLRSVGDTIDRICRHWELQAELSSDVVAQIVGLLAPELDLRRSLRDELAETSAQIDFWTSEQLEALDALQRNTRQLVYGGAGTGKTVLAVEKARRLAASGSKVLLTCFNAPLARRISLDVANDEKIQVFTFHGLCRRLAGQAGLDFPTQPSRDFWDRGAPDLLVQAAEATGFQVDAVVVDEGQDFAPDWWVALELLLETPQSGEFYVFADAHQSIYRDDWVAPFVGPIYELRKNCRNTLPIAARVASVYGDRVSSLGASGSDPEFIEVTNSEGADSALRRVVHRLLNEGKLGTDQLAVLSQSKDDVDRLRGSRFAGHLTTDLDNWGEGFLVETIHRFKGLEADVCVVVLWDVVRPRERSLAYIGMSRAKTQLIVIGPAAVRDALDW